MGRPLSIERDGVGRPEAALAYHETGLSAPAHQVPKSEAGVTSVKVAIEGGGRGETSVARRAWQPTSWSAARSRWQEQWLRGERCC